MKLQNEKETIQNEKSSKFLIYCLIDPRTREVRYVGRSSKGLKRPKIHWMNSTIKNENNHKAKWVRNVISDGFIPEIQILESFDVITNEELNKAEMFWVRKYKDSGFNLVNATEGGGGILGYHHTKENKQRISKNMKGKVKSEETIKKIKASKKGWNPSEEVRKNMSIGQRSRKDNLKPVMRNDGKIYESVKTAAMDIDPIKWKGISSAICRLLSSKYYTKSVKGFTFIRIGVKDE